MDAKNISSFKNKKKLKITKIKPNAAAAKPTAPVPLPSSTTVFPDNPSFSNSRSIAMFRM